MTTAEPGLHLERSSGRPPLRELSAIIEELRRLGSCVLPLDLGRASAEVNG